MSDEQTLPTITTDHIRDVCKPGQAKDTCRYLMVGSDGFECARAHSNVVFKAMLDERVAKNTITAQGDNCEGREGSAKPVPGMIK